MKPVSSFTGSVQSNLDGERVRMGIAEGAEDVLISMVTDLYSDPELAVVREYSTNARDSHIEAGNDAPIEVTTPTALYPYFTVQDYGVGLSVNEIKTIYSQYGGSTKRASDLFNGMLGVGSKSALAFTDQFTVTAVKNGMLTQVIVTRDESGRPIMEVVDTVGTNLPNGVQVKVPAPYGSDFEDKAKSFFKFWDPKTVLLNGEMPSTVFDKDFSQITDTVFSFDHLSADYIVMGNVGYKLENREISRSYSDSWQVGTVAFVEMGEIAFPPNRETVAYNPTTKQTIARIQTAIKTELDKRIRSDIANASSHTEAFKAWRMWHNKARYMPDDLTYKGDKFVDRMTANYLLYEPTRGRYVNGNRSGRASSGNFVWLSNIIKDSSMVIRGFSKDQMTATDKAKLKAYIADFDVNYEDIFLFDTVPGAPWTNDLDVTDWSDIKAIKLNTGPRATSSFGGTIPIKKYNGSYFETVKSVDSTAPIYYVGPNSDSDDWADSVNRFQVILSVEPTAQIIQLGKNRWNKFGRDFPTAKHVGTGYYAAVNVVKSSLTDDDKALLELNRNDLEYVRTIVKAGETLDDPDLMAVYNTSLLDKTRADRYTSVVGRWNKENKSIIEKRYPMLSEVSTWRVRSVAKDAALYINAKYASDNKETK